MLCFQHSTKFWGDSEVYFDVVSDVYSEVSSEVGSEVCLKLISEVGSEVDSESFMCVCEFVFVFAMGIGSRIYA